MVAWYKHDIPAWMDGTEALSDGAYRAYHVICQMIYLNEGPVALNEHGIAGRCRQSVRAFRRNLEELLTTKKLTLENDRLSNSRADSELGKIETNRENAGRGGEESGKSRRTPNPAAKPLKNNDTGEATLREDRSLKTREEKTREDEKAPARSAWLRKEIIRAYTAAEHLETPDTGRAEVWIAQGYDERLIAPLIAERVQRGKPFKPLQYFDKIIAEAHAVKDAPKAGGGPVSHESLERVYFTLLDHEANTGNWNSKRISKAEIPAETIERWKNQRKAAA